MAPSRNDKITAEQWEKAKGIFEMAVDLTPGPRESYLAEACRENPTLLSEIKSLLEHHDKAGSFLQSSAAPETAISSSPREQSIFLPGQLIAERFLILRFVGRGGMGEVYEATDQRLKETIAIKAIRPEALSDLAVARFKQEVLLARRVTHPNVCRVFDLEQHKPKESANDLLFLTMEFVEGETLADMIRRQGRMRSQEALPIFGQIARALAASHSAGVIHRDLKPANVILAAEAAGNTPRAVVTDFGVAKVLSRADAVPGTLTGAGQVVGTTAYMAPEQIEGGHISSATDIYALGLIMYELLTGTRPFSETGPFTSVIEKLKGLPPTPRRYAPDIGLRLESLVLTCLAIQPGQRIQDAAVVARSIEEIIEHASGTTAIPIPPERRPRLTIAVLPFVNMSQDQENEYFSDGLAEELMGALAKVEGLRVVARTSTFRFRGTNLDIREVARQLAADFLVEGTVRRSGDHVRVTLRLINAVEGCHIWDERYDRQMIDVFSMQEEIARTVAAQLKMKLRVGEDVHYMRHRTQNFEAYENFLKARFFWNKRTHSNLQKAEECFQLAMKHDPQFAAALAGLADCYLVQGMYGAKPPNEIFPLAKDMVLKALTLDPKLAEAHCAAGYIHAVYDWDWAAAKRAFERALELDPSYATAHQWYAMLFLLPQLSFAKARAHLQLAREGDPLSLVISTAVATAAYCERRFDPAIQECLRVLETDSTFGLARMILGQAYAEKRMHTEAITNLRLAVEHTERAPRCLAALGYSYGIADSLHEARAVLDELIQRSALQYVSPVFMAHVALGMQNNDQALAYLEEALEQRAAELAGMGVAPVLDAVRSAPRFCAIARKVGLPDRA